MMTDPIADMLTRIRNAGMAGKTEVMVPFSKIKWQIIQVLQKEEFVGAVERVEDIFPSIKVEVKYTGKRPFIRKIRRISKPGRRVYKGYNEFPVVLNHLGLSIISTSRGIMTNSEAKKMKVGGEVICEVE